VQIDESGTTAVTVLITPWNYVLQKNLKHCEIITVVKVNEQDGGRAKIVFIFRLDDRK
jgi:hypothetical protein